MSRNLIDRINQVNLLECSVIENGGELTDELALSLSIAETDLAEKVDGYAFIIENLKERSRYWDDKSALLKKYAQTCGAVVERLRTNLKGSMMMQGLTELHGEEQRFRLQNSPFGLDVDESTLPSEYFNEKVVRTVDREKIRKAIKEGAEIPGVRKLESMSLRVYPQHGKKKEIVSE